VARTRGPRVSFPFSFSGGLACSGMWVDGPSPFFFFCKSTEALFFPSEARENSSPHLFLGLHVFFFWPGSGLREPFFFVEEYPPPFNKRHTSLSPSLPPPLSPLLVVVGLPFLQGSRGMSLFVRARSPGVSCSRLSPPGAPLPPGGVE